MPGIGDVCFFKGIGKISFKYAYAAGETGNIAVDFKQASDGWCLQVSDEGRGLPEGFDIDRSKGFGLQVVKAFVRRLDGKMTVLSRPGRTEFEIRGIQT